MKRLRDNSTNSEAEYQTTSSKPSKDHSRIWKNGRTKIFNPLINKTLKKPSMMPEILPWKSDNQWLKADHPLHLLLKIKTHKTITKTRIEQILIDFISHFIYFYFSLHQKNYLTVVLILLIIYLIFGTILEGCSWKIKEPKEMDQPIYVGIY